MKSIAIIDTPESCILCPFCHYNKVYSIYECRRERHWRIITNYNQKPDWCSLPRLPEEISAKYIEDAYEYEYSEGWNDCLKEIKGEEK